VAKGADSSGGAPCLYVPLTNLLFIDDSQAEVPQSGVKPGRVSRFCVTVGVAIRWSDCAALLDDLDAFRRSTFLLNRMPPELKGSYLADEKRRAGMTLHESIHRFSDVIKYRTLGIWVMVADRTAFHPPSAAIRLAHATALQFLFERVAGHPDHARSEARTWAVVADHVSSREAAALSAALREFTNPFTQAPLPVWIAPRSLAGASEDWAGIQIADVFAYLAAHYRATELRTGGDGDCASAFRTQLWPHLMKRANGQVRGIGYKTW